MGFSTAARLTAAILIIAASFTVTLTILSYWNTPVGTIVIKSASYGQNCGAKSGNVTPDIVTRCGDKATCTYNVDTQSGDPAPGCSKDYAVQFSCGQDPLTRTVRLPAEAYGQKVQLECH